MTIYSAKPIQISRLLLLGIAAGLIAVHLTITWKREYTDLWGLSLLFWMAVCYLLWEKRNTLNLETSFLSSLLGTLIIASILLESIFPINKFPYVSPFISGVGLSLIASGFKGLKQYWLELILLLFPNIAYVTLIFLIDISVLTAKFAFFLLWYLGFEVSRQGVYITLSTGTVEVNRGCSGLDNIINLWVLAVLFLLMLPAGTYKKILLFLVASLLGFLVNGFRVALMALLVAFNNNKAFEYWHTGDGAVIFSIVSILSFSLFCFFIFRLDKFEQDSIESSNL